MLWRRETMYSWRLVEWHFWIALAGTVIYVFAMWNSGIIQGLMWRTYTDAGTLKYSFVNSLVAMHPYYIAARSAACCSSSAPSSASTTW